MHWQFFAHFVLNCAVTAFGGLLLFQKVPWSDKDNHDIPGRFGVVGCVTLGVSAISWSSWIYQIYHFSGAGP